MKNHLIRFATMAALAAGMAFSQDAAPAPTPQPPQAGTTRLRAGVRRRLLQALGLSDAQKQQAKTIFQQARQSAQPLAAQLQQNRQALAAAVKANDTAQIQQLSAQQGTLHGQVLAIRSEAMAKLYAILTPEQRTKADQIQQNIQQRIKQRQG